MKIKVTMKDPDTLRDAIVDVVSETVSDMPEDEREAVMDCRIEKAKEVARTWFEYGEYLTVEIDTDAKTCVVVPKK
jgi:hypothetical protein